MRVYTRACVLNCWVDVLERTRGFHFHFIYFSEFIFYSEYKLLFSKAYCKNKLWRLKKASSNKLETAVTRETQIKEIKIKKSLWKSLNPEKKAWGPLIWRKFSGPASVVITLMFQNGLRYKTVLPTSSFPISWKFSNCQEYLELEK